MPFDSDLDLDGISYIYLNQKFHFNSSLPFKLSVFIKTKRVLTFMNNVDGFNEPKVHTFSSLLITDKAFKNKKKKTFEFHFFS